MGVKSCQCQPENKRENEIEQIEEIIDNPPYELFSNHKEALAINESMTFNSNEQQEQAKSKNPQRQLQEEIKQEENKEAQCEDANDSGGYAVHIKERDKFLRQIPDGPPLEIINENHKHDANNNSNEEDNENEANSPKLTSKSQSMNNALTEEKENNKKQSNNTSKIQPPTKMNKYQPQKSKDNVYHQYNTNPNQPNLNKPCSIRQFISQKKLKQLGDNDVVFTSELDKMINNEDKKSITYSTRFCVLTPKHFSYFSSKENFFSMKKPLCQLSLSLISKVDKASVDNRCLYFSIMFQLTPDTVKLLKNINSFSIINEELNNNEEGMIGFKSSSEETISKWVTFLQYFTQKMK